MTVNVPLLRKTLEHITEHPEEHDQNTWGSETQCGTTMCAAGWAVTLAGYRLDWQVLLPLPGEAHARRKLTGCWLPSGEYVSVQFAAAYALGFDYEQADQMFWEAESAADLWELASGFTDGEIPIPDVLPDGS